MTTKSTKINTQVKTDRVITEKFTGWARIRGQKLPEALEHAMKLYCDEARKSEVSG